jgi:hypothetical protein
MRAVTPTCRWIFSLALVAACGGEGDVDVYVVMPQVDDVCAHLAAARVELEVTGPGPERFTVRGEGCRRHPDFGFDGFFVAAGGGQLRLERLDDAFHWVTARVYAEDGALRGVRVQPFDARESPLAIVFLRPDLPGWPTTQLEVTVPTCALAPDLARVELAIQPVGGFVPTRATLGCAEPRVRVAAPLGPAAITAEGRLTDGTLCYQGAATTVVERARQAALRLERTCP